VYWPSWHVDTGANNVCKPRPEWFTLLAVLLSVSAYAHDPGLSTATLEVDANPMRLSITLAPQDVEALIPLDIDKDAEVAADEWTQGRARIGRTVVQGIQLTLDDRVLVPLATPDVAYDEANNVYVLMRFPAAQGQTVHLHSALLQRLPAAHRQAVLVKRSTRGLSSEYYLTHENAAVTLPAKQNAEHSPRHSTFNNFLHLGIEHIVTGYDHLLFLFGLLLVSQRLWDYLYIITCFTVAHSLTLALAALEWIVVSPGIVEPLIAATIAYVGVENLLCGTKVRHRAALTLGFGLVHGFGFAGALQGLGMNANDGSIVRPLFAFNLGVELGQLSIAALMLPALNYLQAWDARTGRHGIATCSLLITAIGIYWFIERALPTAVVDRLLAIR
jgi:hypothetical protein